MPGLARIARVGVAAAVVVALCGWALEQSRFGATDESALARVETDVRRQFDTSTTALLGLAGRVTAQRDAMRAAPRDPAALKRLFAAVDAALPGDQAGRTGITVYDPAGAPLAWAGRASELPRERIDGPATLFVAPGALGPRLIRVTPVVDVSVRPPARLATIVVEQALAPDAATPAMTDRFVVPTPLAPVTLRVRINGLPPVRTPFTFIIQSESGEPLVDAEVSRADLVAVRASWRRGTWAAALAMLVLTLLLATGPLVERTRLAFTPAAANAATAAIALTLVAARLLLWTAVTLVIGPRPLTSPVDLLPTALLTVVLVWIAVDLVERRRYVNPRVPLLQPSGGAAMRVAAAYGASGLLLAGLLWGYALFLQLITARTTLDLLHFSLHPISAPRLALAFSLVLLHTAVIWAAAVLARLPTLRWRVPRGTLTWIRVSAWTFGALAGVLAIHPARAALPMLPLVLALAAAGAAAGSLGYVRLHTRRTSQAARLAGLFVAVLVPTLCLYPSLLALAIDAKEHLVATEYGPQAMRQRDDLKTRLQHALEQLDTLPALVDALGDPRDAENPTTDRAFVVWSQTDLEKYRLTSAVELYRPDGRLLSRFALNLSEYVTGPYRPGSCDWDLSDEVSPFGSSERHVLRASRGVCVRGRVLGAVVVRVMLDYSVLPFISSQSPYLESLRPDRQVPIEGASGRDVEFAAYGWSRAPLYVSGTSAWTLADATFQRTVESRDPFWTALERDDVRFRVFIQSDRGGIYALGYPVITGFGHLMNLAELVILASVACVLIVGGATLFHALALGTPIGGRALLREIRSSFYRKLFLAFLAAAVIPVLILAILTRQYFANQAQAGIEDSAARTATVAQRLVEDYATLQQQQRGSAALETLDDQIMFLVSRALDDDVNLFNRSRLQATSERDLYASQLLPTRTPGDVYRRILIERAPTYVSLQQVGGISYYLAAAPVRSAGGEDIVTVPLSLRQPEVERQIDELDRRVWLGIVLFSLIGAALGYWRAEQIADPVNRLARATRRIARGDLDARLVATSSDELGRLVADFNRMAADLQRQRTELERTQRLEAWADMARQVAHDIKNPLTPIQLSAEHARRVNIDRGRPLSPALDECVTAILSQVTLLRQIASEFSSFACSPTPRPERTDLAVLLDEVVAPYRTGLADRIAIDVETAPDLPALTIDRTLFARALTNVIENALHAMPGRGRLVVTSRHSPVDGQSSIIVEVTDSGVGMDGDALAKIFEPYFSTKATGTGLGLTIAKRNVELNNGTIAVTSRRGVGTTVTIVLPVG